MIEQYIDNLARKTRDNTVVNPNDYIGDDGLLYCGNCHTRKQTRFELFGKVKEPFCLCKCEAEKKKKEREALEQEQRARKIRELRKMGFPDEEMKNWTFAADDNTNERISTIAHNYVDNFSKMRENGKGLLLFGPVGTGKTFAAACIANALIDKGYPCLVTNFSRLIKTIEGSFDGKQEYIDSLNQFSLLVIDDLATERNTEYMNENVYNIIDSRYRTGLPLIVTTNLTAQELKSPADMSKQRVYSRLFEMCLPVEVTGSDRRRKKLKDDVKEFADILGI